MPETKAAWPEISRILATASKVASSEVPVSKRTAIRVSFWPFWSVAVKICWMFSGRSSWGMPIFASS